MHHKIMLMMAVTVVVAVVLGLVEESGMEYLLIGSFWVFLAVIAYCWVIRFATKDYRSEKQKMEDFMKETDI